MQNRKYLSKKHIFTKNIRRGISLLLSLCMVSSLFCGVVVFAQEPAQTVPQEPEQVNRLTETKAQTKARLLRQIREDNWDPYSSDMTTDEFYALMELFQEGTLPLEDESPAHGAPIIGAPGMEEPGIDDEPGVEPSTLPLSDYIPREMFLFSGLNTDSNPDGHSFGPPLIYDNINGSDRDYPAGLDPYGGYTRPPEGWPGIDISSSMSATVVVPGINSGNTAVSGDVDQRLFLAYENVYVRQVTVQNNPVTVLGAIQQPKTGEWVYYYTTDEDQLIQVSATTLGEGQKFVIHYAHREYSISYQIRYRVDVEKDNFDEQTGKATLFGFALERSYDTYGTYYDNYSKYEAAYKAANPGKEADIADWVRQLPRLADETQRADLAALIFGDEFPTKTDEGKYAFTATAPAGYTLAFYLSDSKDNGGTWINGQAMLVTDEGFNGGPGEYTGVNQGWALGMEPVYYHNGQELVPDGAQGPLELLTTGTFYNNDVDADRIVVAVLRKKDAPEFDAWSHLNEVKKDGSPGGGWDENVGGRGSNAVRTVTATNRATGIKETIPYDYEDEYLWRKYKDLSDEEFEELDDSLKSKYIDYTNGNPIGNLQTGDDWNWNNTKNDTNRRLLMQSAMTREADGTYSFQWTFQCNSDKRGFTLDTLEINRVGVTIPFYAKYSERNNTNEYLQDRDDSGGRFSWWAETTLPDGAVIKVEYLMIFNNGEHPQRVYRISVRGASNNITITNMNLMMGNGAPEIAVYLLDGVTGATGTDNTRRPAIQNYTKNGWSDNKAMGSVLVDNQPTGSTVYGNGDGSVGGANIRFKLASGYSSPSYLFEDRGGRVIVHGGEAQASVERNDNLSLDRATQNPVVPYISDGSDPYMRYDNDGVPYPVDSKGGDLYYFDDSGNFVQFTDWAILRVYDDDSLAPELYNSAREPLGKDDVIVTKGTCVFQFEGTNNLLKPQYIYSGEDGWYYIRLTGHEDNELEKFALLTVVAFPARYVVRYKPSDVPEYKLPDGTVIEAHAPENMPVIEHYGDCPTFLQGDPENTPDDDRVKSEFDDNGGDFYNIVTHSDVALTYTRPTDPMGYYRFVDWMLVDEYNNPVKVHVIGNNGQWVVDEEKSTDGKTVYLTQEVHFASGSFSILDYVDYAIFNSDLGAIDDDIYVLRLVPAWEKMENPYHYKVALRWVDAQGKLHEEYFDDESEGYLWQEVLTDFKQEDESRGPAVKVLTEATPFQNWIALHPTYNFWDAVNNATGSEEEIKHALHEALIAYLPALDDNASQADRDYWEKNYNNAFDAILDRDREYEEGDNRHQPGDDFYPLGNYAYAVYEDYGTIVVWMYEDKGGLVFHKEVDAEPFITDEEFYFTVSQVVVGNDGQMLNGTYKAYPETVYDERTGAERAVKDSDAWLVTFKDGDVTSIVKNDGSTRSTSCFTVKNGEGIRLYVPGGTYTITELGSKSGGTYRTEVTFVNTETGHEQVPKDDWTFPTDYRWLTGSGKTANTNDKDQVSATVKFEVGAHNVAHVINFSNQTSVVAIESQVYGPYYGERLGYTITLILPGGTIPLLSEDGSYYYFNFNLYDVTYAEVEKANYKSATATEPARYPKARSDPDYNEWLQNGYAAWLDSPDYQDWLAWHVWRPEGTTTVNTFGRLVVTKGTTNDDGSVNWEATALYTPRYNVVGIQEGWNDSTYSGSGVIGLMSGQRFYVVCTVPEQDGINYIINETDSYGYKADITRQREGTAAAAELAYELFINTKLAGMPKTGGMGDGAFRIAGLTFLASGLGLVCVNRKEKRRKEELSDPAEWR